MTRDRRRSLAPWLISGSITCVVIVISLGTVVFPALRTPQQLAADAAPPPPAPITVQAENRALNGTVVLRALVAAGASIDLKPSDALIAANPVITALPSSKATSIQTGAVLLEANGEPVIAMNWPFPAYRDLRAGDAGPDVIQLQTTLATLGYASGKTGVFDASTRRGVAQLFTDLGYKAPGAAGTTSEQPGLPEVYLPARDVQPIPAVSSPITSIPVNVGQKIVPDLVLAKLDGKVSTVVAGTTIDRAARIAVGNQGTLTAGTPAQTYSVKVTGIAQSVADIPGLGQGVRVDLEFVDPNKAAPVTPNGTTAKLDIATGDPQAKGLILPITAIYTTQDGGSYVIPASKPETRITVELGAQADGWVEVKPTPALKDGDEVVLGTKQQQ